MKLLSQWRQTLPWLCVVIAYFAAAHRYECAQRTVVNDREFWSAAKFRQLERLLLLYYDEHGRFPPLRFRAAPDLPEHSWRVLLLPNAGRICKERFSRYDFSQEWSSMTNHHALYPLPECDLFTVNGRNPDRTDFLAIDGTEWPVKKAALKQPWKSYLVTKGDDRFLLVEYPDAFISWREPRF